MEYDLLDAGKGVEYVRREELEFDRVYEQYVEDIYRLCMSFMKNPMDAEDAVQETFTRYFCLRGSLDSEEHIKAWLIVTASNYCKDMLKQWWRKRRSMEDIGEMAGAEAQKDNEMIDLVRKLPDKYKTAVYLYYYEGYSSKEIAKILKKPPSTIRTYLQKARKMLKQEFQ